MHHDELPTYQTPENVSEEIKHEAQWSFVGFTIFDIGHITVALFMLIYSLVKKQVGWQEEVSESIIELIFASLLMTFVEGLAHAQKDMMSFRKNYSYAFLCANAALLVPLTIAITGNSSYETNFHYSMLITICFITTLIAQLLFFAALFLYKKHLAWRAVCLVAVCFFLLYGPLMITALFLGSSEFEWEMVITIVHFLIPVVLGLIALIRLARNPKDSVLY